MGFMKRDFEAIVAVDGLEVAVEFARIAFDKKGNLPNEDVLEQARDNLGVKERQDVRLGLHDVGDEDRVCPDIDVTREFVVRMGHCDGLEVSANILKVALSYDQEFSSVLAIRNEAVSISERLQARLAESHRANGMRTNSLLELPSNDRS